MYDDNSFIIFLTYSDLVERIPFPLYLFIFLNNKKKFHFLFKVVGVCLEFIWGLQKYLQHV